MFIANSRLWPIKITNADQQAFAWIRSNTAPKSRFLILTGNVELFCDPFQEWFPVLTERTSETTIQGREWLAGKNFVDVMGNIQVLQDCLSSDTSLACINKTTSKSNMQYDYLLITRKTDITNSCRTIGGKYQGDTLILDLQNKNNYQMVYQTSDLAVYHYQQSH